MTILQQARAMLGARPAVRQPGPVTLAIRGARPHSLPSWEMREQQLADERRALKALRQRIEAQIDADLARVDRCLNALDLMDGDADVEQDVGEMPEAADHTGRDLDNEPSLCGLIADPSFSFLGSGLDDGEHDAGDDREHDEAERGIGDEDGYVEQFGGTANSYGCAV